MKNPVKAKAGKARAASLSADQRKEIARKAANSRWTAHLPSASHEGSLKISGVELPVAVLSDSTRLMISKGFMTALGRPWKGSYAHTELPNFIAAKNLRPFVTEELRSLLERIEFSTTSGVRAQGYPVELLPIVCEVYLEARKADQLSESQKPIADRAEMILRGLARVGIVALVDEATGYQKDRAKDALAKILEKFIAKELQPWIKTFPDEFYEHLFRLRGLDYRTDTVKKPQYFGHLTNDIVYKRLAPGVLEEIKRSNERTNSGRIRGKQHQKLTRDLGHPKLREHLASVVTIMALSEDYDQFYLSLNKRHPAMGETMQLDLQPQKYRNF